MTANSPIFVSEQPLAGGEAISSRPMARPGWLDPAVFPFQSRLLDIDGHRLHYVDEGSGPPLLLLHGAPTWSFLYRRLIPALRGRFRCLALDLPGFGLSEPRPGFTHAVEDHSTAVEAFIDALDLGSIVLMIHDAGGPIGLGAAARRPARFRALITTNTFAWSLAGYPAVRRFLRLLGSPPLAAMHAATNFLARGFCRAHDLSSSERRAILEPLRDRARRSAITQLFRSLGRVDGYMASLETGLVRLAHLPLLNLWATGDAAYGAGFLAHFERLFPHHRTVIVYAGNRATGHFPHENAPEAMAAAVHAWWDEVGEDG